MVKWRSRGREHELEDISIESNEWERKKTDQKGKRWQSVRDLWNNIKMSNMWVIRVPEEERENGTENMYTYIFKWRRRWHPTPVLLPGKFHGRRSLVGFSPWGAKSWTQLSDLTFTFHFHALEKEMATHSSVLAWRILGTGEPGGLLSQGSHRVGHDWSDLAVAAAYI